MITEQDLLSPYIKLAQDLLNGNVIQYANSTLTERIAYALRERWQDGIHTGRLEVRSEIKKALDIR